MLHWLGRFSLKKMYRNKNCYDFTNYMVMLSTNPVPGPVSAGTAGTDLGGTLRGVSGAPASGQVQLHPLASPLHDSVLVGHRQVTGMGPGDAGCPALLKAPDLLYLWLGKQAAISDLSRCERSLSCESLRGEHGNTNITSSEN